MKKLFIIFFSLLYWCSSAQFSITLKYKQQKCGGKKNPDTTSYFLLANQKYIVQFYGYKTKTLQKTDTIISDIAGKIKIPNQKGTYYLYKPWKYYHSYPADYPKNFYNTECIKQEWEKPDFTIKVHSNKKYTVEPQYIISYCPDKHPCIRKDTVIPKIPQQ